MSIQLFTADKRTTVNWASGTSTELFIYPADATFAGRNFLFRISTATVEAEESTFTFFQGITRHLMILKGQLELTHHGRYTRHLQPYDQDTFSGEWNTSARGKVTDFNLMLKNGATGSLAHQHIEAGVDASFTAKAEYYFIFLHLGRATAGNGLTISSGDLLLIDKGTELGLHAHEVCNLVLVEVNAGAS